MCVSGGGGGGGGGRGAGEREIKNLYLEHAFTI